MEMTDILKKHFDGIEAKFGPLPGQVSEALARLTELEQKGVRRGGAADAPKSWGEQFTEAKGADIAIANEQRGKVSMEIKAALTSSTADANGAVGSLIVPQRDQVLAMPQRRLAIRQLLNVVESTSGSVEYPKQTGRNLNAAPVAEGAAKPESDVKFALENVPMRVIAHWMKASRQVMEDIPQLKGLIDAELRYGLALEEEAQILHGDGTGQNLEGLVAQAAAFSEAFPPDGPLTTPIDTIGLAILQAALTEIPPDGIVVHPVDWWKMRLTKDENGRYIMGDPAIVVPPSIFGLPVVPTPAMTAGEFLVGAYGAQTLYDRWTARVEVGFVNDDFTKNLVTVLGEERIGLAAKRPEALVHGQFQ